MPGATITFTRDAVTVNLPAPVPGYVPEHEVVQAVGRTAAGEYYVYDKGVTSRAVKLTIELTASQKVELLAFIDNAIEGCVNTFTYTDHLGVSHSDCRLRNAAIAITKLRSNRFRAELEITTTDDVD